MTLDTEFLMNVAAGKEKDWGMQEIHDYLDESLNLIDQILREATDLNQSQLVAKIDCLRDQIQGTRNLIHDQYLI